jgi:hypothetical protein
LNGFFALFRAACFSPGHDGRGAYSHRIVAGEGAADFSTTYTGLPTVSAPLPCRMNRAATRVALEMGCHGTTNPPRPGMGWDAVGAAVGNHGTRRGKSWDGPGTPPITWENGARITLELALKAP